mmetsp:Transcript_101371/g.312676  ORF Transcript_101371/g.312676 Transcript_101371/m.312676 type:complete len:246 (-) Transcript_101371:89-826(-)
MPSMARAAKPRVASRTRATCSRVRAPSSTPRRVTTPHWLRTFAFSTGSSDKLPRIPLNGSRHRDQPRGVQTCSRVRVQPTPPAGTTRLSPSRIVSSASSSSLGLGAPGSPAPASVPAPTTCAKCSRPCPVCAVSDRITASPSAAWRPASAGAAAPAAAAARRVRRRAATRSSASAPGTAQACSWPGRAWLDLLGQDRVAGAQRGGRAAAGGSGGGSLCSSGRRGARSPPHPPGWGGATPAASPRP